MSSAEESVTMFLNVDLDLRAESGLEELLRHLEPSAFALHQTAHEACLELSGETDNSLEDTVIKMVEIIASLPPPAKSIWDQCQLRSFNIGIQAGKTPHQAYFTLSGKAVSLVASVQSEIAITIYASPD